MKSIVANVTPGWERCADPAWLAGWSPRSFELRDGPTQVVVMGAGPTVVLLPSLPGLKETWIACAAGLARSFRIVTYDLRVALDGEPRWDALVDDLERVLDAFAPGAVGVVGHSLGGVLAQHLVLRRPERVKALVLSSSFARFRTPRVDWMSRYFEQPFVLAGQRFLPRSLALPLARRLAAREAWVYDRKCDERVLDFVRYCIRTVPIPLATRTVALAMRHDTADQLKSLACPTLIVHGDRESAFVREAALELERLIPGATGRVSPGVGHLHPLSGADWLTATLVEWLTPRLVGPAAGNGEAPLRA